MIIKLNNKSKNFYAHLGKVFGSREVEKTTNDRFFDDDNKEWYFYFNKGNPTTFVSIANGVIKNVWTTKKTHLVQVLEKIKNDTNIKPSVVTKFFKDEYLKSGYAVKEKSKNFVIIRSGEIE